MNFTPARPLGEPLQDALTGSLPAPAMARSALAASAQPRSEVEAAMTDARPLVQSALPERQYVIAWDIGSRHDHSVGIVLDVTEEVFDVACYVRLKGDYPQIQNAIQDLHAAFARSSFTVIENNSIGAAVADNLSIPEHQLRRFTTSQASKERIIEALRLRLQLQLIKFQPSLKQLASELRDYQLPDTNCGQDSVMSLAIALEHAPEAQGFESRGRIDGRRFRALNRPVSSRRPISTGIITWTPAN